MSEQGEVTCRCQTGDTCSDDGDVFAARRKQLREDDRGSICEIRRRALGETYRHRLTVALATMPAGILTGPGTNPPENGREDVIAKIDLVCLGKAAVVDRFKISRDIGAGRTRNLTGNILLKPEQILRCRTRAVFYGKRSRRFDVVWHGLVAQGLIEKWFAVADFNRSLTQQTARAHIAGC
jgi:hypothetical protein